MSTSNPFQWSKGKIAVVAAIIAACGGILAALISVAGPLLQSRNESHQEKAFKYGGYVYENTEQGKVGVENATVRILNHPEIFPALSDHHGYFVFAIPREMIDQIVQVEIAADSFRTHTETRALSRDNSQPLGDSFTLDRTIPGKIAFARRSVAILGFWNWSKANGRNPLGAQLSGMLTTELAAGNRIRIVNGEDVARMKHDLVLPDVDTYSFKTRARIGAYLEADHLVIGFYSETEPGQIRVDMRLQDTIQDNPDFVFPEMDSREEIGTLVGRIGEKLRDRLGAGELSDADRAAIKAAIPSTPRNVPLYFGGLARLQEFGNLHAPKAPLQEVVGSEPDFPLAHMALAMTWLGLGYETKAKVEADLAFKYSGKLSGVDRQLVEARYLEISDKWDLAANVYQDLFKTYPDNLDYGLGLVYALAGAENRQNALSTLAGLKNLLPGENESPRIDLAEAAVADRWFDGQVEFEAATRAKMKAQALGAVLQEAKALQYECLGLQKLADLEMALDACRKSQSKFNNAGDVGNGAESLKIVGGILSDLGEFEEARQASEQALRVFANLGNNSKAAGCMNEIGIVLDSQGELSASQKWYEKALDLYLTIDDKLKQSAELHNIGGLLLRKGNLDPALKMYLQSIDLDQKLHHGDFESGSWENIGYIYFLRGDIANALTMLDRAEPLLSKNSDPDKRSSILTT